MVGLIGGVMLLVELSHSFVASTNRSYLFNNVFIRLFREEETKEEEKRKKCVIYFSVGGHY